MIQEEFQFYKPCNLLQPYVRYYWVFKSHRPLNTFTFPIGCPQIIFHKRTPLYIPELDATQEKLTISGQVNFSSHLHAAGDIETIAVVFQPHALNLLLNIPASFFYNQEVSGYDIENRGLKELAAKVFDNKDNNICINHIEEWLLSQITNSPHNATDNTKRISAAIQQIFTAPQTSVTELSSVTCLGRKQFKRQFNSVVGINPKEYARIVRFQKALWQMQHQKARINHAQIAYTSGYSDQSHLIREFKMLCGHTPTSLLKISNPYSDLFTDPI